MLTWFRRRPSAPDPTILALLEAQREDRQATHALMQEMLKASQAQNSFVEEWLNVIKNPPEPKVRIMTDSDEALFEAERRAATHGYVPPARAAVVEEDPLQWMDNMTATFNDFKQVLR